jgi:hypothetical protein
MLTPAIADQLRRRKHHAEAVVADPGRRRLPDHAVLALGAELGLAVVTTNIRDFMPLDRAWKAERRGHAGLILLPAVSFPQDSGFVGRIVNALDHAATRGLLPEPGGVVFLRPAPR